MTDTLPRIDILENNTQRYRAIYQPGNFELYISDSDGNFDLESPFWAGLRRNGEWILVDNEDELYQEGTYHVTFDDAHQYLLQRIMELSHE
jgi:hypothetical protein